MMELITAIPQTSVLAGGVLALAALGEAPAERLASSISASRA